MKRGEINKRRQCVENQFEILIIIEDDDLFTGSNIFSKIQVYLLIHCIFKRLYIQYETTRKP